MAKEKDERGNLTRSPSLFCLREYFDRSANPECETENSDFSDDERENSLDVNTPAQKPRVMDLVGRFSSILFNVNAESVGQLFERYSMIKSDLFSSQEVKVVDQSINCLTQLINDINKYPKKELIHSLLIKSWYLHAACLFHYEACTPDQVNIENRKLAYLSIDNAVKLGFKDDMKAYNIICDFYVKSKELVEVINAHNARHERLQQKEQERSNSGKRGKLEGPYNSTLERSFVSNLRNNRKILFEVYSELARNILNHALERDTNSQTARCDTNPF